jgi:hypothetical protein
MGRACRAWIGRLASLCAAAGLALACGACDTSSTGLPAGALPIAFSFDFAGGAASAFDAADAIAIVVTQGGVTILDDVLPFSSGGSDVRIRLPVGTALDGVTLGVSVELRRGADVLFVGQGSVRASSASGDPAEITLQPVIAAIVAPAVTRIAAIGASLQLEAAAVFATGDTITNAAITYTLVDPGVIQLQPDGLATAEREGTATVRASAGGRSVDFEVEVRIAAATVTVDPAQAIIGIGGSIRLTATVLDGNGEPLSRQPTWTSASTSVATVNADGTVTGIAEGTVQITATVDDAQGTALIEVSATPPPATPTGVSPIASGTTITLSWQDNASNETSYEVRRGPTGGSLTTIATLPPDSRLYVDGGLPIDQVLDYVIVACNGAICSESVRITSRTVPAAPSSLTQVAVDPVTRIFRIGWSDNSVAETAFNIQIFDPAAQQFLTYQDAPAEATEYQGTGTPGLTETFRVRACNEAGCSAPTNQVSISFPLAPPLATTLPTITNTEMVGATDGWDQPYDWFFEFYDDPSFIDPSSTSPVMTSLSGQWEHPIFDLGSQEKLYYRMVAVNSAGYSFGAIQMLTAPQLEPNAPSTTTVCNLGPSCKSDPSTITFSAFSTGPLNAYPDPFEFVAFDIEFPSFLPIGSGTASFVDIPGAVREWTYTFTFDPSSINLPVGNYTLVVRGYPGSSSGNVVTTSVAFTVTSS